jgi:zinc transporter 2
MVQGNLMFIVAVVGLFFNIIQIRILHGGDEHFHLGEDIHSEHGHSHGDKKCEGHGKKEADTEKGHDHDHHHDHDHDKKEKDHDGHSHPHAAHGPTKEKEAGNLNMDAATLHVLGDLLSSVGVIIASIFIYFFPSMWIMDPICTYIFAIFVSYTTLPTVRKLLDLMMEATPDVIAVGKDNHGKDKNLNIEDLGDDILKSCNAICEFHDLHVWKLGGGKMSMTCHIISHKPSQTL